MEAPRSLEEARAIQEALAGRVVREGTPPSRVVAGFDVSEKGDSARAAVVVMRDGEVVEEAVAEGPVPFPYVPGFLSFREIPSLLEAWGKIRARPDVAIVDGQGIAHPRRLGIASHLGVLLDLPTIGCAKSVLVGRSEEPGPGRGAWSPLLHRGETIGAALRTRAGCAPVYVSLGHRITLEASIRIVLEWAPKYRLPEPQRRADKLSKDRQSR